MKSHYNLVLQFLNTMTMWFYNYTKNITVHEAIIKFTVNASCLICNQYFNLEADCDAVV